MLGNMAHPAASALFLREAEVRRGIELLAFGHSALLRAGDDRLAALGLGRAHARALYFIARAPDSTVTHLLGLLGITKQSLGRVLNELIVRALVESRPGARDRRERVVPGKTPRVRRGEAAARRPPERRLGFLISRDVHESRRGLVAAPGVSRVPRARGRAVLEPRARDHRAQVLVGRVLPVQSIHRGG